VEALAYSRPGFCRYRQFAPCCQHIGFAKAWSEQSPFYRLADGLSERNAAGNVMAINVLIQVLLVATKAKSMDVSRTSDLRGVS